MLFFNTENTDQRYALGDFPIEIKISDCSSAIWDSNIQICPMESKRLLFQLFGPSDYSSYLKHSRTSFFLVSSNIPVYFSAHSVSAQDTDTTTSAIMSLKVQCAAMLCTSVLFIESNELQMEWNEHQSTYNNSELQVWNRSECTLLYRIEDIKENEAENRNCRLIYSSFSAIQSSAQQSGIEFTVPPFASQRIFVSATVEKVIF